MAKSLSLTIGLRFLLAKSDNKFISFISLTSMLGIAVGILVLTVILSAMNGFERELTSRLLSVVPHAEITAVTPPLQDWQGVIEQAKVFENVESAAPFININALIVKGNELKGVQIRGIDPQIQTQVSDIKSFIEPAAWHQLNSANGSVVLGQGIIADLGLKVGEKVYFMLPQPNKQGRLRAPKTIALTLAGSFSFGGQLDYSQAYIHLSDAINIVGEAHGVSGVELKFIDIFDSTSTIRNVANSMNQYLYISDWKRSQGHLYNDIQMVKFITYIVLVLVIGVASFNIVSTLVMAVQDKESEIAILLTMGLTQARVMRIFIVQGMLNALLGCLIGSISGYLLATNLSSIIAWLEHVLSMQFLSGDVYFIDFLPSLFKWQDLALLVASTLVISFIATLYPASKAAKIEPAKVLGQ
ncbi:MAG: lipoprotein-releasing ABC transporter permease subunit LolE [Gammaproteobacteria bacterium]|nr:lipoprotein-releasing ABC transporter permease subunit LolE [Gammaproteobacteria bacterium]